MKTLGHIYYLCDWINNLKNSGTWKIHLTMKMKFMLLKDSDEKCRKHSKSDTKETMTGFDTEELIQELLNHFFHRQVGLEQ